MCKLFTMFTSMFSRLQREMRPILLQYKNNKYQFFINSVAVTTVTGAGIGSIVGLYDGIILSQKQKEVNYANNVKITLGGCFNGYVQGAVYGCYPLYAFYIMLNFLDEYNRLKNIDNTFTPLDNSKS